MIQFYSIYWVIMLINTVIRYNTISKFYSFYGIRFIGIKNFIVDFLGWSKLIGTNGFGDWFVSAIIILYLVFPVLYRLEKRFSYIPVLLSLIPWIIRPVINGLGISTDSFLFCLLYFSTGIFFARTDFFEKLYAKTQKIKMLSSASIVVLFGLRLLFSVYVDLFLAISLICFGIYVISDIKYINSVFIIFGKNSANIWLSHVMILELVCSIISLPIVGRYLLVLFLALLFSLIIEFVKKKTKYSLLVKKIRRMVER